MMVFAHTCRHMYVDGCLPSPHPKPGLTTTSVALALLQSGGTTLNASVCSSAGFITGTGAKVVSSSKSCVPGPAALSRRESRPLRASDPVRAHCVAPSRGLLQSDGAHRAFDTNDPIWMYASVLGENQTHSSKHDTSRFILANPPLCPTTPLIGVLEELGLQSRRP